MAGRPIADPDLEAFAAAHSTPLPLWLAAVEESTRGWSAMHGMMVGPLQGRLLAMLVALSGARHVLEIGTFTGYSALCMAESLPEGGSIVSCEIDPQHAARAREHIAGTPHADRIEVRLGPALETIGGLPGPFDLVFIDADKPGYLDYYEAVLARLSPGGLVVVDNVLWSGRVLDPAAADVHTRALVAFNAHVAADPRVECVMLTIRDGLTVIRRRA